MVGNENGECSEIIYGQIEDICDEIDAGIVNDKNILDFVRSETFSNFLCQKWNDPEMLIKFLRIIVFVQRYANDERFSVLEIFDKVLKSNLLKTIIPENISKMKEKKVKNRIQAKLFHFIIEILIFGYENHLTKMDDYEKDVCNIVTSLKTTDNCMLEMTKEKFEQLEKIYTDIKKLKAEKAQKKAKALFKNLKFTGNGNLPPENFRTLSLIPSSEELEINFQPYLRSAKLFRPYYNCEHYLDVQFRLLREDLISPLRTGIEETKTGKSRMHCYKNVKVIELALHLSSGEYIHYVKIHENQIRLCKKTLKMFSLLCLSSDKYQTEFLFASVADREDCLMYDGKIGIKFESDYEIDFSKEYQMVESPAYFEAYRHILLALQNVKPIEPLPFEKYLVYGYTETHLPQYTDGTNLFDFSCIFTDDAKNELPTTISNVTELKRIPIENFILNESQFNAFTYALESEISLIQGPPGTGKSYIGLQLAKFLLNENNWQQWNHRKTPLLIVCYTNHALDQFLKGICDFVDDKIVRVGSKCKDRVVIKYMMHQWRKEFSNQNHRTLIGHTKRLDSEIVKLRSYFKQLNSGLACREAMLFISDNEFLTDERFIEWLTLWNPTKKIYELNVQIIKELIGKGVTESKAREAYASACTKRKNMEDIDVNDLYKQIKRGNFYIGEYKHHTRHWPLLKDIEAVMDLGYSEKVAIALLQNANMDVKVIKEECKKYPVKIEKKVEILSDDEGDFEEDPILKLKNEKEKERRKQERKLPDEVKEFGEYIRSVPEMKDVERKDVTDIWKLPLQKRWRLYQHWCQKAIVLTKQNLELLERDYYFYKNQVNELNKELDREILKSAKVIGMTTTGAAKYQSYLKELKPAIVIAEEAAEVLEAHIFTSLTSSCQQLILIGDHEQLRPNTSEYKLKDYHFDVSLFERLILNGFSHKMLTTQHRMRPEISLIMQKHFYDGLINSESVLSRPNVKGLQSNVVFIQHSNKETYDEEVESRKNGFEMRYALSLAKYLLQQGYNQKQISIICTYGEQRYNLRKNAKKLFGEKHDIRIENVDNYQGEESDIIILSLVRSESTNGKIGYLNIKNRICVALSRAKIGMFVIGNFEYLSEKASNALWSNIRETVKTENYLTESLITKCQKHGTEQIIKNFNGFNFKCPEGGCQRQCDEILECGHICSLYCHGYDMEHMEIKCEKPCSKICYHDVQCKMLCHEKCEPCEFNESENGNCYYFISESSDSIETTTENETLEVVTAEYPRNAEIELFLNGFL